MKSAPLWLSLPLIALLGCPTTEASSDVGNACACDTGMAPDTGSAFDAAALLDAAATNDVGSDAGSQDAPATCSNMTTMLEAAAANVLFLSESDRMIEVRVFAGAGTSAPTEASVVARAALSASATSATRPTANFARAFEPNVGALETAPATLSAAIDASLRDLIYVAIIDPAAPAEVHVILAGRTLCGDLVFLQSISIET